ncbi:GvpL/GvpF family gas vesicle protein [Promicromonospora sp. MEB111]|uniref:GvpL/GvpF family gas vesicle protein n=1 Tax=unclassified Promicromonospora TaxID=2647929 RepID=UPI0025514E18|nr:GvpL/GvpF family gas vesicle protein [Promicromonospora sp. MEB111]
MLYVYGLVLPDTDVPAEQAGLGEGDVHLVGLGEIAALTSEVPDAEVVGVPAEIRAYTAVLDGVAAARPVLPMRFGTAVLDEEAMAEAFPVDRRGALAEDLRRLDGLAQLTVRARYVQDAVLAELVAEDAEVAELRALLQDLPTDATYDTRIRLGELVVRGFARKRAHDAAHILDELTPFAVDVREHETGLVDDVVEIAALVRRTGLAKFDAALEGLAARSHGRITFRLVGPQAPYDFVGEE